MLLRALAALVVVTAMLLSASADAQTPAMEQAKQLADAGRSAAATGKYAFAIQAYRQAHQLTLDEELLFAIANAHRQRNAVKPSRVELARAVEHYRRYLATAPDGKDSGAARKHLGELSPQIDDAELARLVALPPAKPVTRLAISSDTLAANVRIDGGKARKLPLFLTLKPGRHLLEIRAKGYITELRDITLGRGRVQALRVALDPRPAKLAIEGPVEAVLHIDGEFVTALPADPIDVEPGKHQLTVSMRGHHTHTREIEAMRSRWLAVEVELERTSQRKGALALVAVGSAGIAAGIYLGVQALIKSNEADELDEESSNPEVVSQREGLIGERDNYQLGSGLAAAGGFACWIAGSIMYVLDLPDAPAVPGDVSLTPVVGPEIAGGSVTVSF